MILRKPGRSVFWCHYLQLDTLRHFKLGIFKFRVSIRFTPLVTSRTHRNYFFPAFYPEIVRVDFISLVWNKQRKRNNEYHSKKLHSSVKTIKTPIFKRVFRLFRMFFKRTNVHMHDHEYGQVSSFKITICIEFLTRFFFLRKRKTFFISSLPLSIPMILKFLFFIQVRTCAHLTMSKWEAASSTHTFLSTAHPKGRHRRRKWTVHHAFWLEYKLSLFLLFEITHVNFYHVYYYYYYG